MPIRALWRNCRISSQKARLVADAIRGKNAESALATLADMRTKASQCFYKVLASAIANAENNHGEDVALMTVSEVRADRARYVRRYMARAKGRGDRIQKPYSHLLVVLNKKS